MIVCTLTGHGLKDVASVLNDRVQPITCSSRPSRNSVDSRESKMSLIVQKYGGTSVGTPDRILQVAGRIFKPRQAATKSLPSFRLCRV